MHEHFDASGTKTGETVVTRESPWSDSARERALELQRYEDSVCKCGCGLPMHEAHTKQPFKVDKYTDWAAKAIEAQKRADRTAAEREFGKDKIPDGHFDGLHYYAIVPDPSELREDRRGD